MTTAERARRLLGISFLCMSALLPITVAVGGVVVGFSLAGDDLDDLGSAASITLFVLLAALLCCAVTGAVCVVRGGTLEMHALRERHERERQEQP